MLYKKKVGNNIKCGYIQAWASYHTQISSYELGDDLFDMLTIEYTIIYEFPKI